MGGEDEMELIKELPEGLRRDIKRYICLELVRKVLLFHNLDDLILDNICGRVKPVAFSKDEKIIREGDPVQRMLFTIRGHMKREQGLSKGMMATSVLELGGFLGYEVLSWCLHRPFLHWLPSSSPTFICMDSVEGFGLDANHIRYITEHFRYKFANERLKRMASYNLSGQQSTFSSAGVDIGRGPLSPFIRQRRAARASASSCNMLPCSCRSSRTTTSSELRDKSDHIVDS